MLWISTRTITATTYSSIVSEKLLKSLSLRKFPTTAATTSSTNLYKCNPWDWTNKNKFSSNFRWTHDITQPRSQIHYVFHVTPHRYSRLRNHPKRYIKHVFVGCIPIVTIARTPGRHTYLNDASKSSTTNGLEATANDGLSAMFSYHHVVWYRNWLQHTLHSTITHVIWKLELHHTMDLTFVVKPPPIHAIHTLHYFRIGDRRNAIGLPIVRRNIFVQINVAHFSTVLILAEEMFSSELNCY